MGQAALGDFARQETKNGPPDCIASGARGLIYAVANTALFPQF
jgi:hypothetical protein